MRLNRANRAPFSAFLRFEESAILSLSPERFIQLEQGQIQTRPIKGTLPRLDSPQADAEQAQRLANSPKDRAENLMIVDLMRNDIGRVAVPGSVRVPELFIVELPQDEAGWKAAGDAPLSGTETTLPAPPRGVVQRRLTFTHHRAYPGLVNVPRHWVRCNPQGTQIAFLMRDDNGIVQLWLISPQGGEPRQLTHNKTDIQSAFNWHPSGEWLGFVLDNRIACAHAQSGEVEYLTENHANPPSADAVVFSPDGQWLAWMEGGQLWITETDR